MSSTTRVDREDRERERQDRIDEKSDVDPWLPRPHRLARRQRQQREAAKGAAHGERPAGGPHRRPRRARAAGLVLSARAGRAHHVARVHPLPAAPRRARDAAARPPAGGRLVVLGLRARGDLPRYLALREALVDAQPATA